MNEEKSIYQMEIEELWPMFNQLMNQETEEGTKYKEHYTKEIEKIKKGIKIEFPITYLTRKWYEEYPSSKKVKIYGYGKYDIITFNEEKEEREILMRQIIIENSDDGSITTPRGD